MANGRGAGFFGKFWNRGINTMIGTGVGIAAAGIYRAPMRAAEAAANRQFPNEWLAPNEAAAAVVRGILGRQAGENEAEASAINSERFSHLIALAGFPPDVSTALELWRREQIDEGDFRRILSQSTLKDEYAEAITGLYRRLLSPEVAASLVAQDALDMDSGLQFASMAGMTDRDFRALVLGGTRPMGAGEILDLLNRGEFAEGEAREALSRLGIESRYIAPLLELRNVMPTPSDLIRFLVREVFSPDVRAQFQLDADFPGRAVEQGRKIGISEQLMRDYWAAHWDLPSPQQGFAMFHRAIISHEQLATLLRALDVNPFWRDKMIQLAYNLPGRIDLRRMFAEGIIDKDRVYRGYLDLGYDPENARHLTNFAIAQKVAPERDLAKAEILQLFREQEFNRTKARELLTSLRYSEQESDWLLDLAESQRNREKETAVVSVVRSRFLAREIDETEASDRLTKIGIRADRRDFFLDLWTFQRAETPNRLSEAQLRTAYQRGLITEQGYRERLAALGFLADDVDLIVLMARPAERATTPKTADFTRADILRFYRQGKFDRARAEAELSRKGFDAEEIKLLLNEIDEKTAGESMPKTADLTRADILRFYKTERFTRAQAEAELAILGLDQRERKLLLDEIDDKREQS